MKQHIKKLYRLATTGLSLIALLSTPALATNWPDKPVHLIIPYPPGGGTDLVARLLAPELAKQLGQNIIIENKPGGNTIIGSGLLTRAKPDGYTFGLITDSHVINPHIMKDIPYDTDNDFVNVTQLVNVPFVLVASKKLGVSNVKELVEKAKKHPGEINFASLGTGSPHYLAMEWFANVADIDIAHIPYTGVGPALTALAGDQVELMFTGLSTGLPQVAGNRLTALGITTNTVTEAAPDIPAIAESGFPNFSFITWYGLVAPKGTPEDIIRSMSEKVKLAIQQPNIQKRLLELGVLEAASTPEEFTDFINRSAEQYNHIFTLINQNNQLNN